LTMPFRARQADLVPLERNMTTMPHTIEPAATGRAKCRGCGERIAAQELRFGESLPNPFADGETKHWFHLDCGSFKRPEPFLEALLAATPPPAEHERLEAQARDGIAHRRLPRIDGAERAPTGRAQCRGCKKTIDKDAWRVRLVFFEEGMFSPAGFVHAACSRAYFETTAILPRIRRFAPGLAEGDLRAFQAELDGSGG
jgi:hypothetical protein